MSDTPGNPNEGWKMRSGIKSLQLLAADIVGNTTELLFLRYQDQFNKAVPWLKTGFKNVMYVPVKMLQDPIEWALSKAGNFEGKENQEARLKQSKEQRLDGLLDTGYNYSSALGVGLGSLMFTEKILSKAMKTGHTPAGVWFCVDAPVHLGLVALLGAPGMQHNTEKLKNTIKSVMQASGWEPEKAEQDARLTTLYIVPNYATWFATTGAMTALYYAESKGMTKGKHGLFKNLAELGKKLGIGHDHHSLSA